MGNRGRRNYHQERHNRGDSRKFESMLDRRRMTVFLYNAKQIVTEMKLDENVWNSILSTIATKANRISIEEAQAFIVQKVAQGELPKEAEEPLIRLLDRHSKMR